MTAEEIKNKIIDRLVMNVEKAETSGSAARRGQIHEDVFLLINVFGMTEEEIVKEEKKREI